jgi:superfamily II DNA or RNA helicase
MIGYEKSLRDWQVKCLKKLDDLFTQSKRALVVATPGGGKTRLALTFATQLVRDGKIDHVHIVAPTRPLCRQWQLAAAESGIYLGRRSNSRLRDAQLPLDIGGVITTYSQVAHDADAHLANMENRNALVILDECHHPADRRAWGDAISQAFDGSARFVLSLSGTPFRDDGHRISLISYTPDGVSKSDFNYTYGEAIADDVCRPVIFKHYNALVQYKMRGEKFAYNFSDDVPQNQRTMRFPRSDRVARVGAMPPVYWSPCRSSMLMRARRSLRMSPAKIPWLSSLMMMRHMRIWRPSRTVWAGGSSRCA